MEQLTLRDAIVQVIAATRRITGSDGDPICVTEWNLSEMIRRAHTHIAIAPDDMSQELDVMLRDGLLCRPFTYDQRFLSLTDTGIGLAPRY